MRAPTPREWRFLIEPLAWAVLLPVVLLTLGDTVFWVAVGGIVLVHLLTYFRTITPGEVEPEAPGPETAIDRLLGRAVNSVRGTPGLSRVLMAGVVVLARSAERNFGGMAYLVPLIVAGVLGSALATAYPGEDTDEDLDDSGVAGDPAEDGLTLPPPP